MSRVRIGAGALWTLTLDGGGDIWREHLDDGGFEEVSIESQALQLRTINEEHECAATFQTEGDGFSSNDCSYQSQACQVRSISSNC